MDGRASCAMVLFALPKPRDPAGNKGDTRVLAGREEVTRIEAPNVAGVHVPRRLLLNVITVLCEPHSPV